MSRQCNQKVCCPVYAGDHEIKVCDAPRDFKKCINCISLKNKPKDTDVAHAAWEHDRCTANKYAINNFKRNLFEIPSSLVSSKN
jgi:hypothetical protein